MSPGTAFVGRRRLDEAELRGLYGDSLHLPPEDIDEHTLQHLAASAAGASRDSPPPYRYNDLFSLSETCLLADVVQLPEEWKYSWVTNDRQQCPHSVCAEPLKGETYQLLRAKAVEHNMYIIYGTRENATDGAVYNTAVVLDRKGEIAATCAHATSSPLLHSNPAASL